MNYSTTFTVDKEAKDVFTAINNVRAWWSGDVEGETDQLGAEFTYRYGNVHYSRQAIAELRHRDAPERECGGVPSQGHALQRAQRIS